jgi:hypothetical protein
LQGEGVVAAEILDGLAAGRLQEGPVEVGVLAQRQGRGREAAGDDVALLDQREGDLARLGEHERVAAIAARLGQGHLVGALDRQGKAAGHFERGGVEVQHRQQFGGNRPEQVLADAVLVQAVDRLQVLR